MPCELVAEPYLARVRYHAVKNLHRKGLKQTEIADLLEISQGLVSSLLKKKKRPSSDLEKTFEKLARKIGTEIAEILLLRGRENVSDAIERVCSTCKLLRINGPTCTLHYEAYPELKEIQCTACHGGKQPIELIRADRFQIIGDLKKTAVTINSIPNIVSLVPEIGMQLVAAVQNPESDLDIAGFPGRIRKHKGNLLYQPFPEFGASTHTAKILLLITEFIPSATCLITVKSSLRQSKDLKPLLTTIPLSFDTLKKGEIREKLATFTGTLPIAFIGTPAIGIEGITYIAGDSLPQITTVVRKILGQN